MIMIVKGNSTQKGGHTMYKVDDTALETARENVEKARKEMEKAVKGGEDVKGVIGRWVAANQSYMTFVRMRYSL